MRDSSFALRRNIDGTHLFFVAFPAHWKHRMATLDCHPGEMRGNGGGDAGRAH